ncbi:MAG: hypothetical protein GY938_16975 [Ketobacter sp.]|nr:hypothetical protein [Ketobacter sp.]
MSVKYYDDVDVRQFMEPFQNKIKRLQADNKRLENLNQAALYWLLGIEQSIASDERGNPCCYFDDGEMERLAAFIEALRDGEL